VSSEFPTVIHFSDGVGAILHQQMRDIRGIPGEGGIIDMHKKGKGELTIQSSEAQLSIKASMPFFSHHRAS
jgi:hypothetical protein